MTTRSFRMRLRTRLRLAWHILRHGQLPVQMYSELVSEQCFKYGYQEDLFAGLLWFGAWLVTQGKNLPQYSVQRIYLRPVDMVVDCWHRYVDLHRAQRHEGPLAKLVNTTCALRSEEKRR